VSDKDARRKKMTITTPTDSAAALAARVARDPELQQQVRADPVTTLQSLAQPAQSDRWVYRIVVIALGLVGIFVVVGVFVLKAVDNGTVIPDAMVAIGSAAIAAMAALLAPSPTVR
jgi:hypothetical protein